MLRKILISVAAILLLGGSWYLSRIMADSKKEVGFNPIDERTAIYVDTVRNQSVPVTISTTGQVLAKEKVQLFAEVQGIMERGQRRFFEGTYFRAGEVLMKVNADEFIASLKAQRSNLYNQIIAIMPDMRLDYPEASATWEAYIAAFDVNNKLKPLPEPRSEQEKYYIAGKQINSAWYSIKNLEVKLDKHAIRAPFNGYVSEALVKEGTLIRPGQKLGEFFSPEVYELPVMVNASFDDLLTLGKKVETHNLEKSKSWAGTITRINNRVDPGTQSITAFIELRGKDLFDGLFLEAELDARAIENAYEISRKLIDGKNNVFLVENNELKKVQVEPVYYNESTVVVRGLPDQSLILSNPVPGAYTGMQVEIIGNK